MATSTRHVATGSARLSLVTLLLWNLLISLTTAREYLILEGEPVLPGEEELDRFRIQQRQNNNNNYQFTGALAIYGNGGGSGSTYYSGPQQTGSSAVQAQCPADHPVSCSALQEPYYCCPANNYCAWSNSIVSCCPDGATCYAQQQNWQPTTTVVYAPPVTQTVYQQGSGYVSSAAAGSYCTTLVAHGPGLPATEQGACGTILILPAEAVMKQALGIAKLVAVVIGLQLVGGMALLRR